MSESRKRRGASVHTPPRRRMRRDDEVKNLSLMRAITASVVVVAAVASGVAHTMHHPSIRRTVHEPKRLVWEEHVEDLEERDCFKRMYRMPQESFGKLAALLAPLLQVNSYFAGIRTINGAISHQIRLAVALRILAGASYLDVAVMFGLGLPTVYQSLWLVIDAINKTPEVGPFFFPQTEFDCRGHAARYKRKSTNGIFASCVACVDGLFIKTHAPSPSDTANVLAYYSGQKSAYGINVQAMCTADYRFCSMSAISPGSTNDWAAWLRSSLSRAIERLPTGYYILGDAAYPLSDKLLTPYPGKCLPPGEDTFNFHLSQLRVKIEQSFGILVGTWGILWRPLRVQYAGRTDLITALFHLHNFLQDEKVTPVQACDEDEESGLGRPAFSAQRTLSKDWQADDPKPSRSGETGMRAALREILQKKRQWRPDYNIHRNAGSG